MTSKTADNPGPAIEPARFYQTAPPTRPCGRRPYLAATSSKSWRGGTRCLVLSILVATVLVLVALTVAVPARTLPSSFSPAVSTASTAPVGVGSSVTQLQAQLDAQLHQWYVANRANLPAWSAANAVAIFDAWSSTPTARSGLVTLAHLEAAQSTGKNPSTSEVAIFAQPGGNRLEVSVNINSLDLCFIVCVPYGESDNVNVFFGDSYAAELINYWGNAGWAVLIAAALIGGVVGAADPVAGVLAAILVAAGYQFLSQRLSGFEGDTYYPNGGASGGYLEFDSDSFNYYIAGYVDSLEVNAYTGSSWANWVPNVPYILTNGFSGIVLAEYYSAECDLWISQHGTGWIVIATSYIPPVTTIDYSYGPLEVISPTTVDLRASGGTPLGHLVIYICPSGSVTGSCSSTPGTDAFSSSGTFGPWVWTYGKLTITQYFAVKDVTTGLLSNWVEVEVTP